MFYTLRANGQVIDFMRNFNSTRFSALFFADYPTAVWGIVCRLCTLTGAVLTALALPATAATTQPPLDYHLELQLYPDQQRLVGEVTLTSGEQPLTPPLRLDGEAVVAGFEADGRAVPFTFENRQLWWSQPARTLSVRYQAVFKDPLPVETLGVEDPSYGVRATILPQGTFLAAGVAWFPQSLTQRGRHHLRLTAPEGLVAVTAGRLVSLENRAGETVSTWHNDFPLAGLALAAGHYQLSTTTLDEIQLLTFLTAENAHLAAGYQAAMQRHLAYYRNLLGPYPFAKFAVVENFLPTGYGLPSWTLLGNSVVRLPFILDTSLPHEIVHSWWGNAVEVDHLRGNWAEGLTTYLADYLLKEVNQEPEALAYRQKILRDYAALVTAANDFPLRAFSGRMARYQQAVGYGKGAMVFHMLRKQIGETAFWEGLRQMAVTGSGQKLGWPELERIFTRSSGQDLRSFFRQWVEQPGAPELRLDQVQVARRGAGWTVSGEIRQLGTPYRLEVPLQLTTADGRTLTRTVALTHASAPFQFDAPQPPLRLDADPAVDLFRRLAAEEVPATVNDLINSQRPLVVVATGQQAWLDAARTLLKGLRWEDAEFVDESDFDPAAVAGRDLLLLGWPQRPELRPALPAGLVIGGGQPGLWQLDGKPLPGDVLFAVTARRQQQLGARALLLASTPAAARAVAAKISHYGRYSLLLFEGGQNQVKSTWEPQWSPLTFVFPKEP
jgi:aminopeptidase N